MEFHVGEAMKEMLGVLFEYAGFLGSKQRRQLRAKSRQCRLHLLLFSN